MQPELYRIAEVEQLYLLTVPSHYLALFDPLKMARKDKNNIYFTPPDVF